MERRIWRRTALSSGLFLVFSADGKARGGTVAVPRRAPGPVRSKLGRERARPASRGGPRCPRPPPTPHRPRRAGVGMAASTPRRALIPRPGRPADRPGQALRMAGGRDLDIATARQQVLRSLAELQEAAGSGCPASSPGPTFYSLNGQVQAINGQIQTVHRDSLSLGTTATLANSFPAPPPGSGYPPLNSLSGVLRISDAIYQARAAKRVIAANKAGVGVANNNALLAASEAYFDLQLAAGTLAIAREAAGNADSSRTSPGLTPGPGRAWRPTTAASSPRCGAGSEHPGRRRAVEGRLGRAGPSAGARPARRGRPGRAGRGRLPTRRGRRPARRPDLSGVAGPPRAAQARELVEAAVLRLKQAKLRPFVPSLAVSYSGAGFGGGQTRRRQFRGPERPRREPVLGTAGPRPQRPRGRPPQSADKNTANIDLTGSRPRSPTTSSRPSRPAPPPRPDRGGPRSRSPRRANRWS